MKLLINFENCDPTYLPLDDMLAPKDPPLPGPVNKAAKQSLDISIVSKMALRPEAAENPQAAAAALK